MSTGDKDFGKDNERPDDERLPGDPKHPEDSPDIPDLPPPEPEDVPGISVHVPAKSSRFAAPNLPTHLFKKAAGAPTRWYQKLSGGQRRKARMAGGAIAGIAALGILIPAVWLALNPLPDVGMLENYSPIEAIKIYDIHNRLAAVVAGDEDRLAVKLKDISPSMRKAMLAAEDHEFYEHGGFNFSSIVRAAVKNLQAGRVVEGGSTITQQLVKNLFFPGEPRTINRKVKEAILATQVDGRYEKDQILEMYLNQIYFGNQSYGIERAAQRYFSKPAAKLSLAEAAFLAGVVKSPSQLSAPQNRALAIKRQRVVLDKMAEYKFVSEAEVAKAKQEKLAFRKFVSPFQKYPFYVAGVMDELRGKYTTEELQRGLKVYTNLDPLAQTAAEAALSKGIGKAPRGVEQGALVSVRVTDGAVLALVGGVGQYEKNQWNRALSAHTMGSSFKPFVYLSGFLNGKSPDDMVLDAPVSFPSGGQSWSPRNFEGGFMGAMTIRKALAYSRNICAAKVAHEVGIQNVIATARKAGLTSTIEPYLPISLGAAAASPLEMAGAYSTFARGGVQITPQLIRRIENNEGKVVATFEPQTKKVFDSNAVAKLLDCMQAVITNGTGLRAKLDGRPVAGKTGTSDAARDIWFCGFTADTATAVWGGNDHNQAIHGRAVTGGMIMAAIFKDYMDQYYKTHPTPVVAFMQPAKDAPKIASADLLPMDPEEKKALEAKKAAEKKQKLAQANIAKAKKAAQQQAKVVEQTIERAAVVDRTDSDNVAPTSGTKVEAAPEPAPPATRYTTDDKPSEKPAEKALETAPAAEPRVGSAPALEAHREAAPETHRIQVPASGRVRITTGAEADAE